MKLAQLALAAEAVKRLSEFAHSRFHMARYDVRDPMLDAPDVVHVSPKQVAALLELLVEVEEVKVKK